MTSSFAASLDSIMDVGMQSSQEKDNNYPRGNTDTETDTDTDNDNDTDNDTKAMATDELDDIDDFSDGLGEGYHMDTTTVVPKNTSKKPSRAPSEEPFVVPSEFAGLELPIRPLTMPNIGSSSRIADEKTIGRNLSNTHSRLDRLAVRSDAGAFFAGAVEGAVEDGGIDSLFASLYLSSTVSVLDAVKDTDTVVVFPTVTLVVRDARFGNQNDKIVVSNLVAKVPLDVVNGSSAITPIQFLRGLFAPVVSTLFKTRPGYMIVSKTVPVESKLARRTAEATLMIRNASADGMRASNSTGKWPGHAIVISSSGGGPVNLKSISALAEHTTATWLGDKNVPFPWVLRSLFMLTSPRDSYEAISANAYLGASFDDDKSDGLTDVRDNWNISAREIEKASSESDLENIRNLPPVLFYRCPSCVRVCWVFQTATIERMHASDNRWLGCAIDRCALAGRPSKMIRAHHQIQMNSNSSTAMRPVILTGEQLFITRENRIYDDSMRAAAHSSWQLAEFSNLACFQKLYDSRRVRKMLRMNGIVTSVPTWPENAAAPRTAVFGGRWHIKTSKELPMHVEKPGLSGLAFENTEGSAVAKWGVTRYQEVVCGVLVDWFNVLDASNGENLGMDARLAELSTLVPSWWWAHVLPVSERQLVFSYWEFAVEFVGDAGNDKKTLLPTPPELARMFDELMTETDNKNAVVRHRPRRQVPTANALSEEDTRATWGELQALGTADATLVDLVIYEAKAGRARKPKQKQKKP